MTDQPRWKLATPDPSQIEVIAKAIGISKTTAACLVNRGICSSTDAVEIVDPKLADLDRPERMADLEQATERVTRAIMERERVGIFGDYDVDGVSSAALMTIFLQRLHTQTFTKIADRFRGYGLSPEIIDHFAELQCSLVIVLDCGTSDHPAAKHANEVGIDVVVIDHHRVEEAHPPVTAFVNPQRADCGFSDKSLATVGLAFYFVAALRTALVKKGRIARNEVDPRSLLDLVALGTVADVMPLRQNNRILVKQGLELMSHNPRPGVEALTRIARIRSAMLRTDHIAYQLAPRLNAAGRMSNAQEAYNVLVAGTMAEAECLATNLDRLSKKRRLVEEEVLAMAQQLIRQNQLHRQPIIVVAADGWHKGVLGIVAARLTEQYGKPTYVIGMQEDTGVGSARGQGQIDLYESLLTGAQYLTRFGGHRDAAGFTVQRENIEAFTHKLEEYARAHWSDGAENVVLCDARLNPSAITPQLLGEVQRLGPFGEGFPEPVFFIDEIYVLGSRVVGGEHLKLDLKTPTGSISAFGPRMGALADQMPPMISAVANLIVDEWKGGGQPELRLVLPPVFS